MPRASSAAREPERSDDNVHKLYRAIPGDLRFNEALTLARLELGLTQQEAGERIGLPPEAARRTFSFYERGERVPSPDRMVALKALLAEAVERAKTNHASPRVGLMVDEDEIIGYYRGRQ